MPRKDKSVWVHIPVTKYQRYVLNYEGDCRKILIDFRCIRRYVDSEKYGLRRMYRWKSPSQLRALVEEYFSSCIGYLYDHRTGMPLYDPEGRPRKGIVKPYTISGLALYIHVDTKTMRQMSAGKLSDLGYPTEDDYQGETYADIIKEARQRIEQYAEEHMYSREGFNGGKFVLDAAFNWQYRKDEEEIQNLRVKRRVMTEELQLKKDLIQGKNGDEPITITIQRAGEK